MLGFWLKISKFSFVCTGIFEVHKISKVGFGFSAFGKTAFSKSSSGLQFSKAA